MIQLSLSERNWQACNCFSLVFKALQCIFGWRKLRENFYEPQTFPLSTIFVWHGCVTNMGYITGVYYHPPKAPSPYISTGAKPGGWCGRGRAFSGCRSRHSSKPQPAPDASKTPGQAVGFTVIHGSSCDGWRWFCMELGHSKWPNQFAQPKTMLSSFVIRQCWATAPVCIWQAQSQIAARHPVLAWIHTHKTTPQ